MSALQIQPLPSRMPAKGKPRASHLYVVPDLPEEPHAKPTKTSARSALMRSPKAKADLADTRGSRILPIVGFTTATLVAGMIGAGLGIAAADRPSAEDTTIASVQAGESLWSIAAGLENVDRPLEDVVSDIRYLNGLESDMLTPGQILTVPTK